MGVEPLGGAVAEKENKYSGFLAELEFQITKYDTISSLIEADEELYTAFGKVLECCFSANYDKDANDDDYILLNFVKESANFMPPTPQTVEELYEVMHNFGFNCGTMYETFAQAMGVVIQKGLEDKTTLKLFKRKPKFLEKLQEEVFQKSRNVDLKSSAGQALKQAGKALKETRAEVVDTKITELEFLNSRKKWLRLRQD